MSSSSGTVYICIKQFNARLGDELSLKVGDKVEVLADDSEYNDGWYMGKNLLTNEVGLYPKTFTQVLQQQQNTGKTLLRSRSRRVISNPSNQNSTTDVSTPAQVNKITDLFEKLSVNGDNKVTTTMNDIDQALQDLQSDTYLTDHHTPLGNKLVVPSNGSAANPEADFTNASSHYGHLRNPSAQSLTEDLNPLKAHEWTPQQVSSYFAIVLGFDMEIAGKFARHKITGAILFELDLAHLKELEITSFGTRFEVHKEIEKLKAISSRNAKHKSVSRTASVKHTPIEKSKQAFPVPIPETTPPVEDTHASKYDFLNFENNSDEDKHVGESLLNTSKNQSTPSKRQSQLLPSANLTAASSKNNDVYQKGHQRKRSQSLDNISASLDKRNSILGTPDAFTSPRKAPEPPSGASPMNKGYTFGGNANPNESPSLYMTRTNASHAGLGLSQGSRPSSSIYEASVASHNRNMSQTSNNHRRNSSVISGHHRRHSSLFLFLSGNEINGNGNGNGKKQLQANNLFKDENAVEDLNTPRLTSPAKIKNPALTPQRKPTIEEPIDIDNVQLSPKKAKSVSYKEVKKTDVKEEKRSASDTTSNLQLAPSLSRLKTLRTTSTQNFRSLTTSKKLKTSAFQEGIREINPDEAIKTANYSGWMSKRSGNTLSWRSRYFTLHGTRLSYFTSLKDKKERGLIDITAHKVIPVSTDSDGSTGSNDKYIALYASSTGFGRYCFKVVPPAPGFKKGLTFTQPKTHYFAVDTQEDMRGWIKALMTATIDIDDTVPVVSSCSTPTVSLGKAQELLAKAREETRLKDEELRAKGYIREGYEDDYGQSYNEFSTDMQTSLDSRVSPNLDSADDTTVSSATPGHPKLSIDTNISNKAYMKTPSTPQLSSMSNQGFASPYLLASGLLSPKLGHSGSVSSPSGTPMSVSKTADYFNNEEATTTSTPVASETTPKSVFSNSTGRILSGSKKKEKLLAYTSDASGNHSFVIKSKK